MDINARQNFYFIDEYRRFQNFNLDLKDQHETSDPQISAPNFRAHFSNDLFVFRYCFFAKKI